VVDTAFEIHFLVYDRYQSRLAITRGSGFSLMLHHHKATDQAVLQRP
jgi:hypothetical protein